MNTGNKHISLPRPDKHSEPFTDTPLIGCFAHPKEHDKTFILKPLEKNYTSVTLKNEVQIDAKLDKTDSPAFKTIGSAAHNSPPTIYEKGGTQLLNALVNALKSHASFLATGNGRNFLDTNVPNVRLFYRRHLITSLPITKGLFWQNPKSIPRNSAICRSHQ